MLLVNRSNYEGLPPRLYRAPEEIRGDIKDIKKRIIEADTMLNARSILMELLSECSEGSIEQWIPALEAILDDAKQTLGVLAALNESLDSLTEELKETKWIVGM